MKVRVTKAFSGYRIGQEFDWADGMARIYVGRGMVEPIADLSEGEVSPRMAEPDPIEEAQVEPKVERATTGGRRKPK